MPPPTYSSRPNEPSFTEKVRIYINTNISYWGTIITRYFFDVLKATVNFINQMIKDALGK